LSGEPVLPGDKSISHRAALLGALSVGETRAKGFLDSLDTRSTLEAISALGVGWSLNDGTLLVHGRGYEALREPEDVIDVGNSGTTIRLLSGILASCPLFSVITGDRSIRRRPMRRIAEPLRRMGAEVDGRLGGDLAPLAIRGGELKGIEYSMPIPSAQVKSSIILAALNASGETVIRGDKGSRDHTERMAVGMGADVHVGEDAITIRPSVMQGAEMDIPADMSGAAFFLAAAVMLPGSEVYLRNVGLNPTRAGFLGVINSMGAMVVEDSYEVVGMEPRGNLLAKGATLGGIEVEGWRVPSLIDELPLLAVVGTQAEGVTRVSGAGELRHKESDRIGAIVGELRKMGAEIEEEPDGFRVKGRVKLKGARVSSHGDHRIAMSLAVAALCAEGQTVIEDWECVNISFPGFEDLLGYLAS
jgi:3-phosphoshikimate 1-carboxyvinyltransferase